MPGAAVLDLASPYVGVNFDETTYFWPFLILISSLRWLVFWLFYCMLSLFWHITAPVAGVISCACVRGGSILKEVGVRMGIMHGMGNSSSPVDVYSRTSTSESHTVLPRTQQYEIVVERTIVGSVRLVAYGLYLMTTGMLQGSIAVLSFVIQSRLWMMSLTGLIAVLVIS
jgi:hypothetical protein